MINERQIFEAALDINESEMRSAYLDTTCGNNTALRTRVEALLMSHESQSQFLNVPALEQMHYIEQQGDQTKIFQGVASDQDDDNLAPDLSFLGPSSNPDSIGTLGHYEILQILGQGAFGIVFKAFDEKLQRMVAIKVMNSHLATTSPPRKRFLREARTAAAIKNENIVQVYGVEEKPLPFIVMEFVEGQTLQQALDQEGPFDIQEILELGRQMASGLAAAHAQGLVHRDIKPGNILIESGTNPKLKITDFGLARAVDDASMTRTGVISGTPMYMAPEQALGQTLDHRADLFSLGSVLYQMACGRPPFRAPNTLAMLKRVVEDTPRAIHEILPEVPDWLETIISKLHAKNPDQRFQSASELADLLTGCQSELQTDGRVTSVIVPKNSSRKKKSAMNPLVARFQSSKNRFMGLSRLARLAFVLVAAVLAGAAYIFVAQPWGPGPNGPWSAADHDRDGIVYRDEMESFGRSAPHRDVNRLLFHFDAADTNKDGQVNQAEIDVYGTEIGSRDPINHPDGR